MVYHKLKQKAKEHYHTIINTKDTPHAIGLGVAVGTLISIIPTPGFNVILGLFIAFLFKKINKVSLFVTLLFWNPLTQVPFYILSYHIGDQQIYTRVSLRISYPLAKIAMRMIKNQDKTAIIKLKILIFTIKTVCQKG